MKPHIGSAKLESLGSGRFRLSGVLDGATVGELLKQSRSRFANATQLEIDLSGVSESDSAGLALLIEWVRLSQQSGLPIRYGNVPEQISALARISEVEDLLFGTAAAPTTAA